MRVIIAIFESDTIGSVVFYSFVLGVVLPQNGLLFIRYLIF